MGVNMSGVFEVNNIYNCDCIEAMGKMVKNSVDFTLTDIPYNVVNRDSNGLRVLDKGKADILTFDLDIFLNEVYRITKHNIIIFCSKEQFSHIFGYFSNKKGTVRAIVWEKTNPSPMNGKYVYLSGVEFAVWFKKSGSKRFNAFCKNTVFRYPNGRSKLHPTEKNHQLLKELILDNTLKDDIVFDPCCGSGAHLLVAKRLKRRFLGFEIDEKYYNLAVKRLNLAICGQEKANNFSLNSYFSLSIPNYQNGKNNVQANNLFSL